jgi:hypothetical protein
MVEFRLPGFDERLAMISSYMDKYLLNPSSGSKQIVVEGTTYTYISIYICIYMYVCIYIYI